MSQQPLPFARGTQLASLRDAQLPVGRGRDGRPVKPRVMLAVLRAIDDFGRGREAWVSLARLALTTGYSVRQVRRAIEALESLSLLIVERRLCHENGRPKTVNHYRIVWTELATRRPDQVATGTDQVATGTDQVANLTRPSGHMWPPNRQEAQLESSIDGDDDENLLGRWSEARDRLVAALRGRDGRLPIDDTDARLLAQIAWLLLAGENATIADAVARTARHAETRPVGHLVRSLDRELPAWRDLLPVDVPAELLTLPDPCEAPSDEHRDVLRAVTRGADSVGQIACWTGLTPQRAGAVLTELAAAGRITQYGDRYQMTPKGVS